MPFARAIVFAAALLVALPAVPGCAGGGGGSLFSPSPGKVAREAFNGYDADKRRRAVNTLAAAPFGGRPAYLRMYRALADDPDPTVRAACAQALGLHGNPDDASILIGLLGDPAPFARWAAARALQKVHAPPAAGPLTRALGHDTDPDVRMAAAHALGQYPRPAVFDALVGALSDTNFGVVHAAAGALATLTGRGGGDDGRGWLRWAKRRRGRLFADARAYTYAPYPNPPGPLTRWALGWFHAPPAPRAPAALVAQTPAPRG